MAGFLFGAFACGVFYLMYLVLWTENLWGSIGITAVVSIVVSAGVYALKNALKKKISNSKTKRALRRGLKQ